MSAVSTGILQVLASAAGFSLLPIFIKVAYAGGMNAITVLMLRFMLAAPFFWVMLWMKKDWVFPDWRKVCKLCLLGLGGYGTMSFLYALTLQHLNASMTAMIFYTYPAMVSLMSVLLGDERMSARRGIALISTFVGLVLTLGVSMANMRVIGIVLGLATAFVYACYIVAGGRMTKGTSPLLTTTFVCSAAAAGFFAAGAASGGLHFGFPLMGWLAIAGIVILGTCVGIYGFFAGMSRIGAVNASIISTMEPVMTVAFSWLLLGESLGGLQIGGGLLIVAGVLLLEVGKKDKVSGT